MEAIVRISGKQYRVSQGQRVTVDRLENPVGAEVTFDQVLMLTDGASATVGAPVVDGAAVTARVVDAPRGRKILIFKYKPKKRYRRIRGHRAAQSVLEVLAISSAGGKAKAPVRAKAKTASNAGAADEKAAKADRAPKADKAKDAG